MDPFRFALAGPGAFAAGVVADFAEIEEAELVAVASRSQDRADAFAREHGIPRAHGSYDALMDDDEVDAIWITTPHPQHVPIALDAIAAGKALLIEKALAPTREEAAEVVDAARAAEVFVMEAMWTRFQPAVIRARELIDSGAIGEVRHVQADLGIVRDFDPSSRLFAPELGGGALLDLGVYVVAFAQMVLGTPSSVHAVGALESNGVEASTAMLLGYEGGRSATLTCDLHAPTPGAATIFGSAGWIELPPRFHHPTTVRWSGGDEEEHPAIGVGYAHELIEVARCVREGRTESDVMPLDDTLAVLGILDEAAAQLGVSRRAAG